jgi:hypothetical protein
MSREAPPAPPPWALPLGNHDATAFAAPRSPAAAAPASCPPRLVLDGDPAREERDAALAVSTLTALSASYAVRLGVS